jgi:hypothetical protein
LRRDTGKTQAGCLGRKAEGEGFRESSSRNAEVKDNGSRGEWQGFFV